MRAFIFSQCLFSLELHIGPSLTWIEADLATWGAFGFYQSLLYHGHFITWPVF